MKDLKQQRSKFEVVMPNGHPSSKVYNEDEVFSLIEKIRADHAHVFETLGLKRVFKKAFATLIELMTNLN